MPKKKEKPELAEPVKDEPKGTAGKINFLRERVAHLEGQVAFYKKQAGKG